MELFVMLPLYIVLIIASYSDIKTHTVPLYLWPIPIVFKCIYMIKTGFTAEPFTIAIAVFVILLAFSFYSGLGGADVLLFASIAFVVEIYILHVMLFSFFFTLPYVTYLFIKKEKRIYPFVPYITLGLFTTHLLVMIEVI